LEAAIFPGLLKSISRGPEPSCYSVFGRALICVKLAEVKMPCQPFMPISCAVRRNLCRF
jgi:hypothetical protein